ncbi:MAG: bifunctional riboflavin kinase/FAD synthetase [Candidatus Malihini olakiniferum]
MQLICGIHNLRARHYGCVLTIGNFDGVHRGHQVLLERLKQEGHARNLPVMVMIFEPQPLELFAADQAPARLTRLRDKVNYLACGGIDELLCVKFDAAFAAHDAQDFVRHLLVEKLGVKFLVVGDDFCFGDGRSGNFVLLQKSGQTHGFEVISTTTFCNSGRRVSSTAVRDALLRDNLPLAQELLGHPYSISGRVVHGKALGRTLGFPTANLPMKRQISPVSGVYAVEVYGLGPAPFPGIANIGTRPTVDGDTRQQLEVHLLDVAMDLYGRHIEVVLCKKIRNEQRFVSLEALTQQIAEDVMTTQTFFGLAEPV